MRYSSGSCRFATDRNVVFVAAERFYIVVNPVQRGNLILQTEIDRFGKAVTHQAKVNAAKSAHSIRRTHYNNVLFASEVSSIFQSEMAGTGCVLAAVIVKLEGELLSALDRWRPDVHVKAVLACVVLGISFRSIGWPQ